MSEKGGIKAKKRAEEDDEEPCKKLKLSDTDELNGNNVAQFQLTSYLNGEIRVNLKKSWSENSSFALENSIELLKHPFQLGKMSNLLDDPSLLNKLIEEMSSEITWTRRESDLLKLNQSCDLISVDSVYLKQFYEFLKSDLLTWMKEVTGLELTHVSASCSMYNEGDSLLVHDDCISDRKIAFVFYLTPWAGVEEWTEDMGGALELFETNDSNDAKYPPIIKILPKNNQLIFFKVSEKSFHQVGEVTSLNYPRLTINGWFHGPGQEFLAKTKPRSSVPCPKSPIDVQMDLSEWLNDTYLEREIKIDIQLEIEKESQTSLRDFMIPEFQNDILKELKTNKQLSWIRPYSPSIFNYETLVLETATGAVKSLVDLFKSSEFFKLLHEYTDLDLHGQHARKPTCFLELQRWTNGCYTMLCNETKHGVNALDVILFLNAKESVGTYVFVNQNDYYDDTDDEEEPRSEPKNENDILLVVEPEPNSLNIVYCNEGVSKFGKLVSKSIDMMDEYVYILCCTYHE